MELSHAVRRRRMCRDFDGQPVDRAVVDRLLDLARRAPSAGFSQGFAFLVLEDERHRSRFWDATLPSDRRDDFGFPGLVRAPVIIVPLARAQTYLDRYAEPDKARAGLGESAESWPVPYWLVDTAFATMTLLLATVDAGLGALFYGLDDYQPVLAAFDVPPEWQPIGSVAIGHPSPGAMRAKEGSAATRPRRPIGDVVHRGSWRS